MGKAEHGPAVGDFGRWAPLLTALVFLVAINLRSALTSVGPLIPQIRVDLGLNEGMLGLLGTLPLVAFALVSPLVHHASSRLGMERVVLVALVVLAAGIVIRSYGGFTGIWAGTAVLGCAIAVGNVLVPAIVKRDYSGNISRATGIYSASMGTAAAVAAALAVPLSGAAGWRGSLAFWAVPALIVAVLWLPRARGQPPPVEQKPTGAQALVTVWKQPIAWLLTAFMGLQSTAFYIMITWLPTIGTAAGFSAERAGLHLFGFQLVGIAAGLLIPRLMRRPDSQVTAAVTASVPMIIAALGLLLAPGWGLLWAIIAGFGSGSSLVVALSLISLRGRTQRETTQLSGMAQSLGYLFAATGPVLVGVLAERTGGWTAPLAFLATIATVQTLVALAAGRGRADVPGEALIAPK